MCSYDSVTPCFMCHNKILLICWYSPVMPPCEPQQQHWFCWTSVFYGCSYRGQPPVCDTLSCGELQCYRVSPPGLMWTLHTLSSSHHGHIGHREDSEDRQLSFVIVWQLWQWQRRHCIGIWSSNDDKLTMLLILMRILNKYWHMTNMTYVKLP